MQTNFIQLIHKNETITYIDKDSIRNVHVNEKELKITIFYKNLGTDNCTHATCKSLLQVMGFINQLRS